MEKLEQQKLGKTIAAAIEKPEALTSKELIRYKIVTYEQMQN